DGYWTAAAHELGHMHGICDEEYIPNVYAGNPAKGFWVSGKQKIENSICLMGDAPAHQSTDARWIDDPHYFQLFRQFVSNRADPAVVLVSALLYKNGTADLRPWYFAPTGRLADESIPGNYSVRVLDFSGQVLSEVTLPISFTMHVLPF